MTIKEVINQLKYLQERYGNITIERLMDIKEIPFYVKNKERSKDGFKSKTNNR